MANPIEYIVYEPDQVLTNDHLNETFNYLDQQNRWTRNKLIGIGVVCGMEIVLNTGVIEITQGCGVTSQGYLITQDDTQYTYYMPYSAIAVPNDLPFTYINGNLPFYQPFCTGKNVWLLLSDDQYNALESAQQLKAQTLSSASANFLSDYVVALFLEASEIDLKNCDMQDCNNKGEKMVLQVRPLLVAKTDLPGAAPVLTNPLGFITNIGALFTPLLNLKRFNVPYADLNNSDDIINTFAKQVDNNTLAQVANAYNYCYTKYSTMLKVSANPFTTLATDLPNYRNLILKQNPAFIEYFYDFIDDLIKAYNEFSAKVTGVISTCCPDENLFPLHLVLGNASVATNALVKDGYRNYFIYSPLFSKMGTESAEVILLFKRMVLMVQNFMAQNQAITNLTAIQITPSKFEFPWLSERAIPYYYNLNVAGSELYKAWNYNRTINGYAALNLSYNANLYSTNTAVTQPLLYDIEPYNFFRVEGHIGQNYQTVLSNILNQRQNFNLPFDVVAISADLLASGASLPNCNFQDLETGYKLILSEAACKIHTTFCFISKMPYTPRVYSPPILYKQFDNTLNLVNRAITSNSANAAKPNATITDSNPIKIIDEPILNTGAATITDGPTIDLSGSINFSAFKLNMVIMPEPVSNTTVAYKKGDFMNTYCTPAVNTLGSAYLDSLDSNGVFTNPIQADQSSALNVAYYYFMQYLDAVEQLMYVLQTNTLDQIDMTAFASQYLSYLSITAQTTSFLTSMEEQDATPAGAAASPYVILSEDLELAMLTGELDLLLSICIDERLKVLKDEYTSRLTQYQQKNAFLNYYKNHPGLEHKAGVPKGGTLVLVYHSVAQTVTNPVYTPPIIFNPIVFNPVINNPVVSTPVSENPVVNDPVINNPVVDNPVVNTPVVNNPVVDNPVVKDPVINNPVVNNPVIKNPVLNNPVLTPIKSGPILTNRAIDQGQILSAPVLTGTLVNHPVATLSPVASSPVYYDSNTINILKTYVNNLNTTDAQKQQLINIFTNQPVLQLQPTYQFTNGTVIADFYIPYLCCSDCPPIAYILPAPPTAPPVQQKPVITIGSNFCDNDTNAEQIKVSVPNGTFNTVPGLDNIKQTFTPSIAGPGTYTITYTVNGINSDPVTVTVLPTPVSTFTFASVFTQQQTMQVTFTPDSKGDAFKYQWTFGPGFSVQTSTDESPVLIASFESPSGAPISTFASLQVSNGTCVQQTVTTKINILPSGLSPAETTSGGIIDNIEKFFGKKKNN